MKERIHILLGVTGGIAAYKSADLVRRLVERDFEVRVVMTRGACEFVTPLTFQALSGHPVHRDLFDEAAEASMGHIELARWADMVVVAPASADFLSRLAYGAAPDLLSTLCLATSARILVSPAMNQQMWASVATRANVDTLRERGVWVVGPAEGEQACGEVGAGRNGRTHGDCEQSCQPHVTREARGAGSARNRRSYPGSDRSGALPQ